uniref:hypothetical protein n=1 Tax=Aquiflexum sp. TaxID=1872584 RepID=UPI003593E7E6
MKWFDKDENLLLQRSFIFGVVGIVLCLIPVFNNYFQFFNLPTGPINGVGIGLQFFGLSIAVLVLRKRKISEEVRDKVKKMILVLAV